MAFRDTETRRQDHTILLEVNERLNMKLLDTLGVLMEAKRDAVRLTVCERNKENA